MNRPLGLWILLSAGVLWLSTQDVHGKRATALIFAKTTTTTTTSSTTAASDEIVDSSEEEVDSTEANAEGNGNSTKPHLTGIPQIDYIYDPNLPKELNGYNLSDYPFYERVPENITFKCDGLHDGFYASVLHKCQVYHHCLYGTRYDFLCANYTAFDQKTFICHFASEVDCSNSKRFWHRNDALYKADTTTTSRPLVIPTTPAPPVPPPPVPVATAAIPSSPGTGPRRGVGRPYRRRRPYYDYYEDYYDDFYYDDRPRSRGRKRPRPRPRPLYDDEYEDEYDDDRYERRGNSGRRNENRRPYNRRPNRGRIKERPKYDYDDEEEDRFDDEEDVNSGRRKPVDKNKKSGSRKRPSEETSEETVSKEQKTKSDTRTIIKPVSGTIYDRPRVAPKIKLPVPKNEANKYAYKPYSTTKAAQKENDEYENYEEESKSNKNKEPNKKKQVVVENKPLDDMESGRNHKNSDEDYYYDEYEEDDVSLSDSKEKEKVKEQSSFSSNKDKSTQNTNLKPQPTSTTSTTTTTTTTSTTTTTTTEKPISIMNSEPLSHLDQPVVIRLVKRPFLPSRGGNPYAARGLQPVGSRALPQNIEDSIEAEGLTEPKYEKNFRPVSTTVTSLEKEEIKMESVRTDYMDLRAAHPSKSQYKNTLDINLEDYDVTLNDALNPTLPNLPVRSYPTGFDVSNDYSYNYQKSNRFVPDQAAATATTNYAFKPKPVNQRYETMQVPREHQSSSNFRNYYSVIEDYRARPIHNTQAYYTRF
ncbi:uncharacterized protein [Diabrotica undecimpunctata]|uniref:uncharacterized protein isoform X1 n=1 Tax=Diabrotica undecimpunctata TaxID=50387 RepID=UPI003B63F962